MTRSYRELAVAGRRIEFEGEGDRAAADRNSVVARNALLRDIGAVLRGARCSGQELSSEKPTCILHVRFIQGTRERTRHANMQNKAKTYATQERDVQF